jgi:hypothetical protein
MNVHISVAGMAFTPETKNPDIGRESEAKMIVQT